MGGLNINTGGGGIVFGDGGVASGVGGAITFQTNHGDPSLSRADISNLVVALGALKSALVSAEIDNGPTWAAQLNELEQSVLSQNGRLARDPARRLLAKIRYAGRSDDRVSAAIVAASPFVRRRQQPVDVFLSYKREDRDRVETTLSALRALAIDVWIDDALSPGGSFTDEICEEIDLCRAQIVCWSAAGAASDWVRGEAEIGRRRGALICVQIEPCQLSPPFNMLHAEDLSAWRGESAHKGWRKVLAALAARLDRPGLLELADAIASNNEASLAAWRRAYPSDPYGRRAHG